MADYEQYNSTNNEFQFSKGPKSLYFAQGDENLLGVILNVPQTDEDDEWGRTERIAMERTVDEIGTLQEYVYDPAGGGTNGLVNKMGQLVGTSGLFDLTVPSLTLGSIVVNGLTNVISLGTSGSLSATGLTLDTHFTLTTSSVLSQAVLAYQNYWPNGSKITLTDSTFGTSTQLRSNTATLTLSEIGGSKTLVVSSGTDFTGVGAFGATSATISAAVSAGSLSVTGAVSVGGTLSVIGACSFYNSITATGVLPPDAIFTYALGSVSLPWSYIYGRALSITGDATINGAGGITIGKATPGAGISVLSPGSIDIGDVFGPFRTVYAYSGEFSTDIHPTTGSTTVDIGQTTNYFRALYVGSISVSTSIIPKSSITTVDLGSSSDPFRDLHISNAVTANYVRRASAFSLIGAPGSPFYQIHCGEFFGTLSGLSSSGVVYGVSFSATTGDIYSSAWTAYTPASVSGFSGTPTSYFFYKKVGKRVFVDFSINGTSNSSSLSFSLPSGCPLKTQTGYELIAAVAAINVSSNVVGSVNITSPNLSTVYAYPSWDGTGWTGSGAKVCKGNFSYETD